MVARRLLARKIWVENIPNIPNADRETNTMCPNGLVRVGIICVIFDFKEFRKDLSAKRRKNIGMASNGKSTGV